MLATVTLRQNARLDLGSKLCLVTLPGSESGFEN
jgi:hypothetical protein